ETAVSFGNEDVARGRSPWDRSQDNLRDRLRRQIFEAVDGYMGAAIGNRLLNLFGENPLAADFCQRFGPMLIARRPNFDKLDRPRSDQGAQQVGDVIGLPKGQPTAAGCNSQRLSHTSPVNSRSLPRSFSIDSARAIGPVCNRVRSF